MTDACAMSFIASFRSKLPQFYHNLFAPIQQCVLLTLRTLGKIFSRRDFEIFCFFPENRIWHFMQIVSNGDLHEISKSIVCVYVCVVGEGGGEGNQKNIMNLSTVEIAVSVLKV